MSDSFESFTTENGAYRVERWFEGMETSLVYFIECWELAGIISSYSNRRPGIQREGKGGEGKGDSLYEVPHSLTLEILGS